MPRPRALGQACTELLYLPTYKDQHIKDISAVHSYKQIYTHRLFIRYLYIYISASMHLILSHTPIHLRGKKNRDHQWALCRIQSYRNPPPRGVYPFHTPLHYKCRRPSTPRPLLVPLPLPPHSTPLLPLATRDEWNELFITYFGILCLPVPQAPGVGGVGGGEWFQGSECEGESVSVSVCLWARLCDRVQHTRKHAYATCMTHMRKDMRVIHVCT